MSNEIQKADNAVKNEIMEKVLISGDLSKLSAQERLNYYKSVCDSLGLNPLTRPFDYIVLNNKLTLYAKRDAADQLRKIHGISIEITNREHVDDLYIVQAKAVDKTGRTDESIGAVNTANLRGDTLANAIMKAETKAKRRVTLSIVGLGWLDESEVDSIPDAKVVVVDDDITEAEITNISEQPKIEQPKKIEKEKIKPAPEQPKEEQPKEEQPKIDKPKGDVISTMQAKRMYAISRGNAELCKQVISEYGYEHSNEVLKQDYDDICEEITKRLAEAENVDEQENELPFMNNNN